MRPLLRFSPLRRISLCMHLPRLVISGLSGGSGKMACLQRVSTNPYRFTVDFVDITKIANRVKTVPEEWINEAGNDVTQEMIDYLLPLIQGEMPCTYKNGVPVHLRLY